MPKDVHGEYHRLQTGGQYRIGLDTPAIPFNEVGRRGIRRIDGHEKASGEAVYTRDIQLQGMLYAKVFTSPYAHARIKSIDTAAAEALQARVVVEGRAEASQVVGLDVVHHGGPVGRPAQGRDALRVGDGDPAAGDGGRQPRGRQTAWSYPSGSVPSGQSPYRHG